MSDRYDVVVVGLGALGSAAALHLARRGQRVLGLERFELGHRRGASHDTSRILRHSYHTPAYVRLTQEAYDDWAQLERWSGEQLVTVTGGLDLFPPSPAIPMDDYTASLSTVGVPFELLDVAEIGAPLAAVLAARRHRRALPVARRDRPRRPRHGPDAEARGGRGGDPERLDPGAVRGRRAVRRDGVDVVRGAPRRPCRGLRGRLDQRGAGRPRTCTCRWRPRWSRRRTSPPPGPAASRRTTCRCGSGWTTRRTTGSPATASPPSRPPRTAAAP